MNNTYLATEELSARIKYDPRTIHQNLKDSALLADANPAQETEYIIKASNTYVLEALICSIVPPS